MSAPVLLAKCATSGLAVPTLLAKCGTLGQTAPVLFRSCRAWLPVTNCSQIIGKLVRFSFQGISLCPCVKFPNLDESYHLTGIDPNITVEIDGLAENTDYDTGLRVDWTAFGYSNNCLGPVTDFFPARMVLIRWQAVQPPCMNCLLLYAELPYPLLDGKVVIFGGDCFGGSNSWSGCSQNYSDGVGGTGGTCTVSYKE